MTNKKPSKQNDRAYNYIKRAGYWNEGIGFVFLTLAVISAYGLSRGGLAALFFLPLIGGLTQFILFLWTALGLAYVLTGYYLHAKSGKYTKPALWVTAVTSLLTIQNIIPAIPFIFSVYALIKLRNVKIPTSKAKSKPAKFDVRDYPALSITIVFFVLIVFWMVQGERRANTDLNKKDPISDSIKMGQKVACIPVQIPKGSCEVTNTPQKFSAVFPSEPILNSYPGIRINTGATLKKKDGVQTNNYLFDREDPAISKDAYEQFETNALDFGNELDPVTSGPNIDTLKTKRILAGVDDSFLCSAENGKTFYGESPYSKYIDYLDTKALRTSITNGVSFKGKNCSIESITFVKGRFSYHIAYISIPKQKDSTKFDQLLAGFRVTN